LPSAKNLKNASTYGCGIAALISSLACVSPPLLQHVTAQVA
jgi:hypothetical protein